MLTGPWRIETFEVIDSTNAYVVARAREGALEGLVVRADSQLAGKGRLDRIWQDQPGSAMLTSILLRPAVDERHLQLVVAAVALSVREAVGHATGVLPDLKWPNDLQIDGKKVGGILAELVTTSSGPAVIIGIGVNCSDHPSDVLTATDLLRATHVAVTPAELLDATLEALAQRRPLLDTPSGLTVVRSEYVSTLDTIGRRVVVQRPDGDVHADAIDIDETGALVIDVAGVRSVVHVGDIVHLRLEGA